MTCRPDHVMEEAHVHVHRLREREQGQALELPLPEAVPEPPACRLTVIADIPCCAVHWRVLDTEGRCPLTRVAPP